jgi:DNA-binding winged helix-turn-helix (wHTH) protein
VGGTSIYATDAPPTAPSWSAGIISGDPVESLRRAALRLTATSSPQRIAAVVAEAAVSTVRAEAAVIGLSDALGPDIRVVHEHGLSAQARQRLPRALSAFARTARTEGATLDALAEPLIAVLIPPRERPRGVVLVGRAHGGPFSTQERRFLNALAAIAALALEHLGSTSNRRDPSAGPHVQLACMQIDLADQEVVFDDRHVHLTPSELRILLFLADEPGRARTRREILRHVWHTEHVGDERACDAHISNLRRKIERDPSRPSRVVTIRNVGYALRVPRVS